MRTHPLLHPPVELIDRYPLCSCGLPVKWFYENEEYWAQCINPDCKTIAEAKEWERTHRIDKAIGIGGLFLTPLLLVLLLFAGSVLAVFHVIRWNLLIIKLLKALIEE